MLILLPCETSESMCAGARAAGGDPAAQSIPHAFSSDVLNTVSFPNSLEPPVNRHCSSAPLPAFHQVPQEHCKQMPRCKFY